MCAISLPVCHKLVIIVLSHVSDTRSAALREPIVPVPQDQLDNEPVSILVYFYDAYILVLVYKLCSHLIEMPPRSLQSLQWQTAVSNLGL